MTGSGGFDRRLIPTPCWEPQSGATLPMTPGTDPSCGTSVGTTMGGVRRWEYRSSDKLERSGAKRSDVTIRIGALATIVRIVTRRRFTPIVRHVAPLRSDGRSDSYRNVTANAPILIRLLGHTRSQHRTTKQAKTSNNRDKNARVCSIDEDSSRRKATLR